MHGSLFGAYREQTHAAGANFVQLLLLLLFDGKPTPITPLHTHYTCVPCRFIGIYYTVLNIWRTGRAPGNSANYLNYTSISIRWHSHDMPHGFAHMSMNDKAVKSIPSELNIKPNEVSRNGMQLSYTFRCL